MPIKSNVKPAQTTSRQKALNKILVGDARVLSKKIPDHFINVTVTSPPYFDLKDYGMPNQIGFGQKYDDYLKDLSQVFKEIYRATVDDGSLWIVIDTFRKDQEVHPLPFDLSNELKTIGWKLRDVIIWKKERTLPWTHKGTTRKIFEYILVLSKDGTTFKYDPDKYRDTTDLKKWWVRYPERYNPKGKSLEEIWSYDIPTQGSWGDKYIRHFCPLPNELVSRIVQLTTDVDGVVFDPFAGSGTVPSVSSRLGRNYSGIELNPEYVQMFEVYLQKLNSPTARQNQQELSLSSEDSAQSFERTIENLRIVKYGRLLLRHLTKIFPDRDFQIFCRKLTKKTTEKFKRYSAEYAIREKSEIGEIETISLAEDLATKPPLSKFGIQPEFKFIKKKSDIPLKTRQLTYFKYTIFNSHFQAGELTFDSAWDGHGNLYSPIKLEVEEPDG